jgi:hypothetical protein
LNKTHQFDAYTDVNLLGKNVNTDETKGTESLSVTSRMIGLEVNIEKTKYTFMS